MFKSAAVVLAVSAVPFTTAVVSPPAQGLQWQQCAKIAEGWTGGATSECTTVRVPLDYDHPEGRQLTLALSRVRASDPVHRRGVVLVNPGGPGEQGTTFPDDLAGSELAAAARTHDLIGFDIRGTDYSDKILCPELDPVNVPRPPAGDSAEQRFKAQATTVADRLRTCATKDPELARSMTTANIARDLDTIRRALGEEKISYFGNSWGTALGATYRGLFDTHVDRMLLDSELAPGQAVAHADDQTAASEAHFDDFTRWLAERDATFGFGGTAATVSRNLLALRGRLADQPLDGDRDDQWANARFLAPMADWVTAADALVAARDGKPATTTAAASPAEPVGNGFDVGYRDGEIGFVLAAVNCNDAAGARDIDQAWAHGLELTARYPVAGYQPGGDARCAGWPFTARPTQPVRGRSPLQLVGHAFETNTPFPWAREMQAKIGGSLLTVEDDVHSSFVRIPCGAQGSRFLETGATSNGTCAG
ncbi:alpha/beta hydrolase [Amycolatopsis rhabdoformis]|uniref:Alpha/beta hydrolase n=1 Tax=Amycolatopsis rhabdoformis TaxID=1448059 RepID=A0ABZ1IJK1_9PSEU|nr:alpha/beta hydrolase [Amycolatopsis rhabdoformis]WSE33739.1 alpha/beta hydrolase [Amycolatopsis rhabdoformis]